LAPDKKKKTSVVLFIAGSGSTDRDGNSAMLKTNTTKLVAEALAENGIASLRYDKVGSGKSKTQLKEQDFTFQDNINNAKRWIDYLVKDGRFATIIVAGHSEGSLVGMVCAQHTKVDAFISLAGTGRPIDEVIKEQLLANPYNTPKIMTQLDDAFTTLKRGDTLNTVPLYLMSLFRPSVQPYIRSWVAYDPAKEIAKLNIPILIVQGSNDIQVSVRDAELLHQAAPKSAYKLIDDMNHIFKNAPADRTKNMATYNNPSLPLHQELAPALISFIKALE
jgi:uncharacterized protein